MQSRRGMRLWLAVVCAVVVVAGCVAPAGSDGDPAATGGDADGKADRDGDAEELGFVEVDPEHSSADFRDYVGRALDLLAAHETQIGRLTYESIVAGRVKIDGFSDLTCWDFTRVQRDLEGSVELDASDYERLREARSPVVRAIHDELDGYQWGDRIYVSRGMRAEALAATLVHEVNHVLNRSEVGYYDDLPTSAFLHEYRAFYAESEFAPDRYADVELVGYVIDLYELDRTAMPEEVLAEPLTPELLPTGAAWRRRASVEDAVDVEEDCPLR